MFQSSVGSGISSGLSAGTSRPFPTPSSDFLSSRFILLSAVALALAGSDHSYFVGPGAAVLALQPDPLGSGPVGDAAPLLHVLAAPGSPVVAAASNPVWEQVGWQTLPGTHQLFDGVGAGALSVRNVLCGPQLPTAHLMLVRT